MANVIFTTTYSPTDQGQTTCNIKVSYSESYNSSTNKTTLTITDVAFQIVDNHFGNYSQQPLFGTIKVNNTVLYTWDNNENRGTVKISGTGYNSIDNFVQKSIDITHTSDPKTVPIELVGGYTEGGHTYFCAVDLVYGLYYIWGVYPQSKNITLTTRHWAVTYNANGGSGAPSAQTKEYGVNLTLSSTRPTRASSTVNSYTVTYNANGGSVSPSTTLTTKTTSYTFSSWNTATNGSGTTYAPSAVYKTNAALTLYAQWSTSTSNSSVTLPTPTKTGYNFNGWYTAASGGTLVGAAGASYTPTKNITLYAHWSIKTYTVSYDANGGSSTPSPQTKEYGTDLTLRGAIARNSTAASSYTVTLNANGGSVSSTSLSASRTTSYTFSKWNTKANGSGTNYNANGTYSANASVILYAQWNSSTSTSSVTLPTPTRTGYNFKFWGTSTSATSGYTGSYTPSGNVILYAIWEVKSFTLTITNTTGSTATVRRTESPLGGGSIGTLSTGATIYYNDKLTISAVASTGYQITLKVNNSTFTSGNSYTVTSAVGVTVTTAPISYTLTIQKSAGVTATVNRTSSPVGGGSTGTLANGAKIYYNDSLVFTYSVATGYVLGTHTVNGATVNSGTSIYVGLEDITYIVATTVSTFSLSLTNGTGSTITVNRTSSPNQGASTGTLINGATLYYGDVIKINYSVDTGYEINSATVNGNSFTSGSSFTVGSNITVVITTQATGTIRIYSNGQWNKYLIYIYTNGSWQQYRPMVYTSGSWSQYN